MRNDNFNSGWNAAIKAAAEAVIHTPAFPRMDYGGPSNDAERLNILDACRKQIETLRIVEAK